MQSKYFFNIIRLILFLILCFYSNTVCQNGKLFRIKDQKAILDFVGNSTPNLTGTWTPERFDRKEIYKSIILHKRKMLKSYQKQYGDYVKNGLDFLEKHLVKYNIEYAGVIVDGKKMLICQLLLSKKENVKDGDVDSFSFILDGGFSVIAILYNPDAKTVISLSWHGEA